MRDSIPAGAGEKMQYMVHDFNDNTIRFVLRYPFLIDEEALSAAVLHLVSSVDVLHAEFIPGRIGARWQLHQPLLADCFTCVHAHCDPLEAAFEQALAGIDASAPVKLHCFLVLGQTESAIVLRVSHLCVDGSDGKYLLTKLCEGYALFLQEGHCARLTIKNGSRAAEQVYTHLSRPDRRRLLKDPRTGVRSEFPFPSPEAGSPIVLHRLIPADVMAAAHEKCRHADATLNDLLLAACYHAYVEATGAAPDHPISLMSMMNLRRHLEGGDSQGLCNLTGALATALPEGLGASFGDTLSQLSAQTRRSKEDPFAGLYGMPLLHGAVKTLPMGLLLAAAGRLYGSMSVGMTNIGSLSGQQLRLGNVAPVQGWFGGPIKKKPGLQISIASFDGVCAVCLWGYAAKGDLPMLQQLLDRIAAHVSAFADGLE